MKKALFLILLGASLAHAGQRERLEQTIRDAGVPIRGISVVPVDGPYIGAQRHITVDFQPSATAQQRAQAQQIIDSFDFTPRIRPTRGQIVAKWNSMTAGQRTAALGEIIAHLAANDPELLAQLGFQAD